MSISKNIAVLIVILSVVPYLLHLVLRKEFVVHKNGIIVISGCSSGIGRHATFEFAKHGYVVFAGVRKDSDKKSLLEEAKQTLSGKGEGAVVPVMLDVTKQEQIDSAHEAALKYSKEHSIPIIAVINNAGLDNYAPFESIEMSVARKLFDTNYFGAVALTQKFLPQIRESKGRVVFVSSLNGIIAVYGSGLYSASKHAMEAAADSLRLEMLPFGVSVSVIQPGYINTAMATTAPQPTGTAEQQKLYADFWKKIQILPDTLPATYTTEVMLNAITAQYPLTRYLVGPAGLGLGTYDSILAGYLDSFTSDRFSDFIKNNL